jgi:hypothetical protein
LHLHEYENSPFTNLKRTLPRNALLDYVEMVCKQISKRFVKPPDWWASPTAEIPAPSLRKPDLKCYDDKKTGNSRLCVRCQEEEDEEERSRVDPAWCFCGKSRSSNEGRECYECQKGSNMEQDCPEIGCDKKKFLLYNRC